MAQLLACGEHGLTVAGVPAVGRPGWSDKMEVIEALLALDQRGVGQVLSVEV
jgi:hypothetical protein